MGVIFVWRPPIAYFLCELGRSRIAIFRKHGAALASRNTLLIYVEVPSGRLPARGNDLEALCRGRCHIPKACLGIRYSWASFFGLCVVCRIGSAPGLVTVISGKQDSPFVTCSSMHILTFISLARIRANVEASLISCNSTWLSTSPKHQRCLPCAVDAGSTAVETLVDQ